MADVGYRSSAEKAIIRERFDLPLVEAMHKKKGKPLRYFGLPGEQALDIKTWAHCLDYVAAVDFDLGRLRSLEHRLDTRFPSIRYHTHHGDADFVILKGGSLRTEPSGRKTWRPVSPTWKSGVGDTWDFDVVYLDYFGKFLPFDRGPKEVQARASALRRLFSVDRQDGWQPWLLLVTVESKLFGEDDRKEMRDFLLAAKKDSNPSISSIIEFLLEEGVEPPLEAARIVQGTLSHMLATAAADCAVEIEPRGSMIYLGGEDVPMLHFAYEINPTNNTIAYHSPELLLRSPILRVRKSAEDPWFEFAGAPHAKQTEGDVRKTLSFLPEELLASLFQ